MKCPYCGSALKDGALYCDICKQPLPDAGAETSPAAEEKKQRKPRTRLQIAFIVACWILSFIAAGIGIYKLVFWIDSYQITRLYTRGAYTPTLTSIEMSDGRLGHALVFYGVDGDLVYLPELNRSLSICGGVARLEIADADWFGSEVENYDYADINFAPILIHEDGTEVQLPVISYTVDAPTSPLKVISPAANELRVVTSVYPVELEVVPGSSVFINGEDLSSSVDPGGLLDFNVSVQPIGDNTYSVVVRTPQHKETRQDVIIYREKYDIEIELDTNVSTVSNAETMTVSGTCEPGAMISVDTTYLENSLMVDMTTGKFSFIAQFASFGDNVVRFRATMPGRQDAIISFSVNYKPPIAVYSAGAWAMDYDGLRRLYEQWNGKVFLCEGTVVDIFLEGEIQYVIMNVATDGGEQLLALQNYSGTTPTLGPKYSVYADVTGHYLYNGQYYPMLAARYLDLAA